MNRSRRKHKQWGPADSVRLCQRMFIISRTSDTCGSASCVVGELAVGPGLRVHCGIRRRRQTCGLRSGVSAPSWLRWNSLWEERKRRKRRWIRGWKTWAPALSVMWRGFLSWSETCRLDAAACQDTTTQWHLLKHRPSFSSSAHFPSRSDCRFFPMIYLWRLLWERHMWLRLHPAQQRGRSLSRQSRLVFACRKFLMLLFLLSHLQPVNKQIHTSTFFLWAVKHQALKWPPQTRSLAASPPRPARSDLHLL